MHERMRLARGRSLLITIVAALISVAALLVLLNYYLNWWDQRAAKPMRSPDGVYAYLETRASLDRLGVTRRSDRAWAFHGEYPKWSPNSEMVALLDSSVPAIYVYDIGSDRFAKAHLRMYIPRRDDWYWLDEKRVRVFGPGKDSAYDVAFVDISATTESLRIRVSHERVLVNDFLP